MQINPNTDYILTKYELIKLAFAQLNKYGADEEIPPEHFQYADSILNMMIKTWAAFGYNLWLKKTAILFLQPGQNTYQIDDAHSDPATYESSYYKTTVAVTAPPGATFVSVVNPASLSVGDYLGIMLDSKILFWTVVDHITGSDIYFPLGVTLPSEAAANNVVHGYTQPLDVPLDVYQGVRNDDGKIDIPMSMLSYNEWLNIPNKTDTTSTPVSFQYDRQNDNTIIRVWPAPNSSKPIIKLLVGQKINNITLNDDDANFPNEWQLPIVLNLAVLLAPAYAKNSGDGFTNLANMAQQQLQIAKSFDNEVGSVYFKPDMYRS